jgi:hypothetical protein
MNPHEDPTAPPAILMVLYVIFAVAALILLYHGGI